MGLIDSTLFTKRVNGDLFVCQIYVDDIIFGSTNHACNVEFQSLMTKEFSMSMMGELKYFLGFQGKQLRGGTFINQAKYIQRHAQTIRVGRCQACEDSNANQWPT